MNAFLSGAANLTKSSLFIIACNWPFRELSTRAISTARRVPAAGLRVMTTEIKLHQTSAIYFTAVEITQAQFYCKAKLLEDGR